MWLHSWLRSVYIDARAFSLCVCFIDLCVLHLREPVVFLLFLFFCTTTGAQLLRSHPTVFRCQTVTNCGEGALASCLDMELENVEETACGSGGMDVCRRAWPADKESDSCYWAVG